MFMIRSDRYIQMKFVFTRNNATSRQEISEYIFDVEPCGKATGMIVESRDSTNVLVRSTLLR